VMKLGWVPVVKCAGKGLCGPRCMGELYIGSAIPWVYGI
jgi:hypothetical protein